MQGGDQSEALPREAGLRRNPAARHRTACSDLFLPKSAPRDPPIYIQNTKAETLASARGQALRAPV